MLGVVSIIELGLHAGTTAEINDATMAGMRGAGLIGET
jgi:hypothetical protein